MTNTIEEMIGEDQMWEERTCPKREWIRRGGTIRLSTISLNPTTCHGLDTSNSNRIISPSPNLKCLTKNPRDSHNNINNLIPGPGNNLRSKGDSSLRKNQT